MINIETMKKKDVSRHQSILINNNETINYPQQKYNLILRLLCDLKSEIIIAIVHGTNRYSCTVI